MSVITGNDIYKILTGATFLASGGGGPLAAGIGMYDNFLKKYSLEPDKITIELVDADDDKYAAVTACIGAPSTALKADLTQYAVNALSLLEANISQHIDYALAVELGGLSTAFPLLVALYSKYVKHDHSPIPVLDSDGAARAVPGLDTLLFHVNGQPTSPLAMADAPTGNAESNRVYIELVNPRNAALAEVTARNVMNAFATQNGISQAGIAGWVLSGKEIKSSLPKGTISKSLEIGNTICNSAPGTDLFDVLNKSGIIECRAVCSGTVTDYKVESGGYDIGYLVVDGKYKVEFVNENIALRLQDGDYIITVPDIIAYYTVTKDNHITAVTNADIQIGQPLHIGVAKVDEAWWNTPGSADAAWKPYFEKIKYEGGIIRYK